ncbi:sensor domain-containing diguanylate cyclase [Catellatospora paridis]|uniref:sensor domain-containing diguanylate cyclase n=1 Tax=Catellatospora paridis TaxID=1617086 RepID=UPI0018AF91A7|nr:sensor domain-containing diguanylate cyclase [Catellatospora paridis]
MPARPGRRSADPVLAALVVGAVVSIAAVLVAPAALAAADVVKVVVRLVFAWLCWQVATRPQIALAARRFWRTLAVTGLLFALGNVLGLAGGFGRASPSAPILFGSSALIAVGVALLGWAMLVYPLDVVGLARVRLRLDVATVMVAFAMLAWHVLCEPDGYPPSHIGQLAATLLGCAMALIAAFGAVKLLISGSAPFTTGAGVALGAGVLIGAWTYFNVLNLRADDVQTLRAAQLASAFLLAVAARVQYLQMRTRHSGLTAHPRPAYSRLPYVAVAVTQLLLVFELWQEGLTVRGWGMVLGTVTVALLVMIRQNLAFTDNARLLRDLDESMLQLRHHEQRFRSLVQHASDLTLLVDAQGTVRYASPALQDLLGMDPEQAVGRPIAGVLRPDDAPAVEQLLADVIAGSDEGVRRQLLVHHADGSARWLEALATNRLDDAGVSGVIINLRDVTEARNMQDQLRHEATHDHLTGLPNRALLDERAQRFLQDPEPTRHEAVLLLDLDDFKAVNDELGHQVGDQLLVVVADRLRQCVRPTDTVARLGGDEFVVLLIGTTTAGAVATARRILDALAEQVSIEGHQVSARASIGVAVGAGEQFDALLRDADLGMYQAKRDPTGEGMHVIDHTGNWTPPSARAAEST